MRLTLVLGGARSGKTCWALGEARRLGGDRVSYIATASTDADDPEMVRRIARHRAERPATWQTVEEAWDPAAALAATDHTVVVLDCLTVLLATHVAAAGSEEEVERVGARVVEALLEAADTRQGELLVVANQVGQGVVPDHPLGRWFRDAQGWANQTVAARAAQVVMTVAGIPLWVKGGGRR